MGAETETEAGRLAALLNQANEDRATLYHALTVAETRRYYDLAGLLRRGMGKLTAEQVALEEKLK